MNLFRTAPHVPTLSAVLAAAGLALSASAQPAPTQQQPAPVTPPSPPAARTSPAAPPAPVVSPLATRTPIVLVEARGAVQIRPPQPQDVPAAKGWERPRPGMALVEGTQVRTGPTGAVLIQVGATQAITVDKLTTMTIRVAANDAGTERTRIDLPQGRLNIDVDSTRIANDVQIATPQTTLAVTGTTFLIEHTSAFGTYARGAETNTGSFNMFYVNGAQATVTGTQESSAATPDPAAAQAQRTQVAVADPNARESDEATLAQRSPGSSENIGLVVGTTPGTTAFAAQSQQKAPPAAIVNYITYDQATGRVVESDLTGARRRTILESPVVAPQAPFSGLSIIDQSGAPRTLFLLRSDVALEGSRALPSNQLFSLDLTAPETGFVPRGELTGTSSDLLLGLGSIGSTLYAHGFDLDRRSTVESVYAVNLATNKLDTVMQLPGVAVGGAGGSNERGALFLAGRLDLFDGSDQHVFLEVDPRTNYMISAHGGLGNEFVPSAGTSMPIGLDPGSIDNVSGLAVVDGLLIMSATALVNNQVTNVVLQYDPAAPSTGGAPRLRRVDAVDDGSYIASLASERGFVPAPSRKLDNSPGPIDLQTINPVFGQMAYGPEALATNVLERMVGNEIINTARDPAGCAASAALDALPSILRKHVDRTSGVGRTVAEFRASLPFMHPCGPRDR